ncbi:MAG TPA: AMP-binding protein, partial [Terriglobales bacterium]|nr:AMP-binding protein [Terriglobales bacterium]
MINLPQTFNVATYFVDRNVREGRATRIAIECGDERISYQQLLERTNRAGNVLRRLGVRPEERVLLLLLDTPEFLYCFFGAIKIGAVAVPANTLLRPDEYEYILNDSQAGVVLVSEALLPQLESIPRKRLRYLRETVVVGAPDQNRLCLAGLMETASPELEPEPTSKDDVAFWLYSSGSTGVPKGCLHLHHDMVVCSELYAKNILR